LGKNEGKGVVERGKKGNGVGRPGFSRGSPVRLRKKGEEGRGGAFTFFSGGELEKKKGYRRHDLLGSDDKWKRGKGGKRSVFPCSTEGREGVVTEKGEKSHRGDTNFSFAEAYEGGKGKEKRGRTYGDGRRKMDRREEKEAVRNPPFSRSKGKERMNAPPRNFPCLKFLQKGGGNNAERGKKKEKAGTIKSHRDGGGGEKAAIKNSIFHLCKREGGGFGKKEREEPGAALAFATGRKKEKKREGKLCPRASRPLPVVRERRGVRREEGEQLRNPFSLTGRRRKRGEGKSTLSSSALCIKGKKK